MHLARLPCTIFRAVSPAQPSFLACRETGRSSALREHTRTDIYILGGQCECCDQCLQNLSLIGQIAGGGITGAILTAIVSVVKNRMARA